MQCRMHAAQLGRVDPKFKATGTQVLVLLGDTIEKAQSYARSLKLPFRFWPTPRSPRIRLITWIRRSS